MAGISETTPASVRSLDTLPGPRGWPILGNALQLRRQKFHKQLEGWAEQYGDPFTFRIASRRFLATASPEVVGSVLRQRPDGFRRTQRLEQASREFGFLGLFSANGDTWRRQRPMVLAGLDPAHIKCFFPAMVDVTERLRRRWALAAADGTVIDLQADLMRYTVDVTTALAFGENLNTLEKTEEEGIQQHLNVVMPALLKRILAPFELPRWMRAAEEKELQEHAAHLHRAVDAFIARTRKLLEQSPDLRDRPVNLIQALVAARDREGSGLTDLDVSGNVLTMLLAGEDTTANTLAWMMWLLHRNPSAAAAARAAVDGALGTRTGVDDIGQLADLDVIDACANETMRLKPVAPFIFNEALQDTVVDKVLVPKGAFVVCLLRPAGLDQKNFPDPSAFDPSRWDKVAPEVPHSIHSAKRLMMPFGAGPRMCPGRYLALAEIKMVAAMLLANFEFDVTVADGGEPAEKISIVMAPAGLTMRLRSRAR
jgi:cytochrome P450